MCRLAEKLQKSIWVIGLILKLTDVEIGLYLILKNYCKKIFKTT